MLDFCLDICVILTVDNPHEKGMIMVDWYSMCKVSSKSVDHLSSTVCWQENCSALHFPAL